MEIDSMPSGKVEKEVLLTKLSQRFFHVPVQVSIKRLVFFLDKLSVYTKALIINLMNNLKRLMIQGLYPIFETKDIQTP
ncbi:MAG: hypothetical protein RL090_673 [Bacteroidota bacterium]|jgi:hypothetical protein